MAFLDIIDPAKRTEIVQDYFNIRKSWKEKNENERAQGLEQREALAKQYEPIIQATKESADRLATEIKSNRSTVEKQPGFWKKGYMTTPFEYYNPMTKKDKYYGITRKGDTYKLGNQDIGVDKQNNISVNDKTYEGTPGLWELLMLNKPENFSDEDLSNYHDIATETELSKHPQTTAPGQKPRGTYKYKNYLLKTGEGIVLPGDTTGLLERLKLVFAERAAGNISSTTPEIVAILDELLRRNHLSKPEYNAVCKAVAC